MSFSTGDVAGKSSTVNAMNNLGNVMAVQGVIFALWL